MTNKKSTQILDFSDNPNDTHPAGMGVFTVPKTGMYQVTVRNLTLDTVYVRVFELPYPITLDNALSLIQNRFKISNPKKGVI